MHYIELATGLRWGALPGRFSARFTLDIHVTTSTQKEAAQTIGNILTL